MKRTAKAKGLRVVTRAEAAKTASAVVCVPWSAPAVFGGDVRATCARCGVAVRHRPYAPKVPKICTACFVDGEDCEGVVTAEGMAELEAHLRKRFN